MAQIEVKFDHQLKQTPIVLPLVTPDGSEEQGVNEMAGINVPVKQTAMYGIRIPLIKIKDIVVDMNNIVRMELDGRGPLPRLNLSVIDRDNKIRGLQNPGSDNEIRIQILPRFENAYKKIDLTFYAENYRAQDSVLTFNCIYKLPALYDSRIKCFGEVSTYDMFEQIAKECQLGFASNVEASDDIRYLYCANTSYNNLMESAIATSGASGEDISSQIMYDYWVDFWNNLNFVDVYERYNTVEPDENIQVWIGPSEIAVGQDEDDEHTYSKETAIISNNPLANGTELFIDHYNTINNSTQSQSGSDRVLSIYNMNAGESLDYLLSDGDQQKDVFTKYEYVGECYSNFNYLLASRCRNMMKNKMGQQIIEVVLGSPMLSLSRGGKVNLAWYDMGSNLADIKAELGDVIQPTSSNIPLPDDKEDIEKAGPMFRLNRTITGQYYILNSVIRFENGRWTNTLQLVRPRDKVMSPVDMTEAYENIER